MCCFIQYIVLYASLCAPYYDYDPNKEKIIDIQESRKNKFFVTTRTDDEYLQYIVVKKNNKYLIDSKKRKFLSEDKWSVDYL